ncbi:DUF302 domain-containing protein [Pararhizobium sp. DWP3-4]|uniref:DUF302 domain-containing protein n=1 Tax=unclassified Pararhizobium TaxID=2643050 RepID=UPI003CE851DA
MHSKPIEHRTTHTFDDTLSAIMMAINKAGLTIFAEIDHAKVARENGMAMPETRVLIYGNPKAGTPVMLDTPLSALDLPLRILVRELPGGRSAIAFHSLSEELGALGVKERDAGRLDEVQQMIAKAVDYFRVSATAVK